MAKLSRNKLRLHRKRRVRARIFGTVKKPRLAVFKSLTKIEAQLIDDVKGVTIVCADTRSAKAKNDQGGAKKVGELVAKRAKEKKISAVMFDRGGYRYGGKVKALADGAREGGLKF